MRIFVSINWSEEGIAFLQTWQEKLRQQYGIKGYWRKPNNLHLTLRFIGEVGELEIPNIHKALEEVGSQFRPFTSSFKELGVFPNIKAPRILWMGVQSPVLLSLQSAIEKALRNIELSPEYRGYQPHITLASGGIDGINEKILREDRTILRNERVAKFELMQSVIERGSHIYRSIGNYSLKKEDATI